MATASKENHAPFLFTVAMLGWLIPGAGYWLIREKKRAIILCVAILLIFFLGLYVGSIGVIDPVKAKPWYAAQILNSPVVFILGHHTAAGGFDVYGKPCEIGQIYTATSGLLNLLCVINCVYLAYQLKSEKQGA